MNLSGPKRNSTTDRARLGFSRGHWIAFAILMLLGWMSNSEQRFVGRHPSGGDSIQWGLLRTTNRVMTLDALGIKIAPGNGWICLQPIGRSTEDSEPKNRVVFVNAKSHLITTIDARRFRAWPPVWSTSDEGEDLSSKLLRLQAEVSVTDVVQLPKISRKLVNKRYGHMQVDWFQAIDDGCLTRRFGRVDTGAGELLIEVLVHGGISQNQTETALGTLLESIHPIR
ncbi:hypothetical protein [Planctomycetes bacterium K23_9]|uniref:Uncharacterized protein n=1 Tax=Stieleria marina TaxID=1930275 RepID=A0A517P2X5_9BACT|nr:hypothetical protein K239x_57410 [Planctomycetes bacterium K23_9]